MLRDRDEPMNVFTLVSALSLALDPVLTQLDHLLDDDSLFQAVKADLSRRFPRPPIDGRPSTPVEVILRMLVVKHLYGWSYEATERWVSDSLVLRQFCRVYVEAVPDETTLLRWANLIQPATLHRLLDHVVRLARALKVTHGRKLRLDGTVVETTSHHPTDSTLLYDGVRVLSRALTKAKHVLQATPALARQVLRDRTRSAKRHMKRIMEAARQRGAEAADRMQTAYQHLLDITLATIRQAQQAGTMLKAQALPMGQKLAKTLDHVIPLVGQVVTQTTRRVLQGEAVPASEKLVSLCEPHTAIIRKANPASPLSLAASSGWTRSRAGSSGAMRSWRVIQRRTRHCRRVWTIICGHSSALPACSRGTAGSTLRRMSGMPPHTGSSRWSCPSREPSRPHDWRMSSNGGAGEATTGARASRAGSAG